MRLSNSKLYLLLRLLPRPIELYDRVTGALDRNWEEARHKPADNDALPVEEALKLLGSALPGATPQILAENAAREIESEVLDQARALTAEGTILSHENADITLAHFCYLVCRVLAPSVVLETGVAYGVTSAFVLRALAVNGKGSLTSVELPPLTPGADKFVGRLVPRELRDRWRLCLGPSKRLLPGLLPRLERVDIFIHDSLHTRRNMKMEFCSVWPYLTSHGVLIVDDVNMNDAFVDFVKAVRPSFSVVVKEKEKNSCFGLIIKGRASP